MTDFAHLYDEFTHTADRIEIAQEFAMPADDPSLAAFRSGAPRPERSLRTSSWLSRLAAGVLGGKQWRRVRAVEWPLSEYLRWELLAYAESQACGEEIRLIDRGELDYDGPEPWMFDLATDHGAVGTLHYTPDGAVRSRGLATDPAYLAEMRALWDRAWTQATPLNEWLALTEGARA